MAFVFDEKKFREESEMFYQTYPVDVSALEEELTDRIRVRPHWYRRSGHMR